MYISACRREEAYYLCALLSSAPVAQCIQSYMNPTSISAHVLNKLRIPSFDGEHPLHRTISALCEEGHRETDAKQLCAIRSALDAAAQNCTGSNP